MEYPVPTGTVCIIKRYTDSTDRSGCAGDHRSYKIYKMEYKCAECPSAYGSAGR